MLARGRWVNRLWLVVMLCALPRLGWAQNVDVPVPALGGPLNDYAQIAGKSAALLEAELTQVHVSTGVQFVVLTIPTLGGEPVASFAHRVMETWHLGTPQSDLGLLLVVVPNDRLSRLETGYGLEGVLPDATCKSLLADILAPKADGKGLPQNISGPELRATVRAVGEILAKNKALGLLPEATPARVAEEMPWWWPWALLGALAVVFVMARALMASIPRYGDRNPTPLGQGGMWGSRQRSGMNPGLMRWLLEVLAIILSGGGRGGPPQGGGGYSGGGGRSGGGGASDRY